MREVPSSTPYPRPEKQENIKTVERMKINSLLEGPDSEHSELSVAIAEDGALRRVNFWDLDNTLLGEYPLSAQ